MAFEHYINRGGERLRRGYTTGTCAALAAGAATRMLISGSPLYRTDLVTPAGIPVAVALEGVHVDTESARCAVRKDAGDDVDVTRDLLICAEVRRTSLSDVVIDGGEGVGRVTRPGLDQPVGAAAINSVPRRMIGAAVSEAREALGYCGGIAVTIRVPGGQDIASRTFNPHLGIEGGISILGTTGIVEPMSLKALVDTIEAELSMLRAEGARDIILAPGNYGERFAGEGLGYGHFPMAKCSNFVGEAIDLAAGLGFRSVLLVGHIGKLVKVAGSIMDTHSRTADGRAEILAAHAALAGADRQVVAAVMDSVVTDEALDIMEQAGVLDAAMVSLAWRLHHYLARRAAGRMDIGAVVFSNKRGLLCETERVADIRIRLEEQHGKG